jgi:AraC-like DNA-binding protein
MLQDRRRPLWPVAVMVAPLVVGNAFSVATRSDVLLPVLFVYFLLMWLGLIIYMVRAIRQYGRWLRDNYADLEHKEVWQGFVVLVIFFLVYTIYSLDAGELIYEFATEVINIVLICYLLWRVETLSDLSISQSLAVNEGTVTTEEQAPSDDLGPYLQKYCIDTQLYLQHDLTITQLAQALGTNRFYLSKYFSRQGITYNAYINDLRIHHFISLYREAVADLRPFTAQQLAHDSGYRSYSTFSLAFKQRMGLSVTVWMRDSAE